MSVGHAKRNIMSVQSYGYGLTKQIINILYIIDFVTDPNERGSSKYGDPCSTNLDCDYSNSICDNVLKICHCHPEFPVTNYVNKCAKRMFTWFCSSNNESLFHINVLSILVTVLPFLIIFVSFTNPNKKESTKYATIGI